MSIELVAFDWSGTIVDDKKMVHETLMEIFKDLNIEKISFDEWLSFVSTNPSGSTLSKFFLENHGIRYDDAELDKIWKENLKKIVLNGIKSVTYPDSLDIFEYLSNKGKKIVVISFQPGDHILREANECGLNRFITRIVGSAFDKSTHLTYLCRELSIRPENALFVGDMTLDIQAAKKAGVISVAITTGYHSRDSLLAEKPSFIISSLSELRSIV